MPTSRLQQTNPFVDYGTSPDTPATAAMAITPNDTTDLAIYAKAIRVLNTGSTSATLRVTPVNHTADDASGAIDLIFPPGLWVEPLAVRRIWSTGTGATISAIAYIG